MTENKLPLRGYHRFIGLVRYEVLLHFRRSELVQLGVNPSVV